MPFTLQPRPLHTLNTTLMYHKVCCQSEHLLRRKFHIFYGIFRSHCFFQCCRSTHYREKCIYSVCIAQNRIVRYTPRKRYHFFIVLLCQSCHTYRCFPHHGLAIEPSLSRHYNISHFYLFFHIGCLHNKFNSRFKFRI